MQQLLLYNRMPALSPEYTFYVTQATPFLLNWPGNWLLPENPFVLAAKQLGAGQGGGIWISPTQRKKVRNTQWAISHIFSSQSATFVKRKASHCSSFQPLFLACGSLWLSSFCLLHLLKFLFACISYIPPPTHTLIYWKPALHFCSNPAKHWIKQRLC